MKEVGKWWSNDNIKLVEIDEKIYALYGWNGEQYCDCWQAVGEYNTESSKDNYILTPIYQKKEGDDYLIIGYDITKN